MMLRSFAMAALVALAGAATLGAQAGANKAKLMIPPR